MKRLVTLLVVALHMAGCVSTQRVRHFDQYAEINGLGRENAAIITVDIDSSGIPMRVEYEGDYVTVGKDSVLWADPATQTIRSAPTNRLRRVRFINRGTGALDGLGLGALPGVAVAASAPIVSNGYSLATAIVGLIGLAGAGAGMYVGAIVGTLIGHKNDYEFPSR